MNVMERLTNEWMCIQTDKQKGENYNHLILLSNAGYTYGYVIFNKKKFDLYTKIQYVT